MNEGEGLAEVVKVDRMCNIPWFSGWLVYFGLEIKGIFLDIKVFCAAPSRGGISRRLFRCWSADYLCVRVSIVWIIRCKGVIPTWSCCIMTREPEPPSYRSPASGGRPRYDVCSPCEKESPDWEVRRPARESQVAGLRRRHSPAGVCVVDEHQNGGRSAPCWWYQ